MALVYKRPHHSLALFLTQQLVHSYNLLVPVLVLQLTRRFSSVPVIVTPVSSVPDKVLLEMGILKSIEVSEKRRRDVTGRVPLSMCEILASLVGRTEQRGNSHFGFQEGIHHEQ